MPIPFSEIFTIGTTLRILFYVDDVTTTMAAVPQPSGGGHLRGQPTEFGLRIAKELLEAQSSFMVRFRVDVLNRNYTYASNGEIGAAVPGANKLDAALLKKYDQVWFFGQHYANYTQWDPLYGGPQSELTDAEVAALRAWMDAGGGVLMTGDHSNVVTQREPFLADTSLRGQTLNLGRALGHRVPRAGQMRVWSGPPDAFGVYVDTAGDPDMSLMPKQEDATPQSIRVLRVLRVVHLGHGGLLQPWSFIYFDDHALFRTTPTPEFPSARIDILPDHVHEGATAIPRTLDPSLWPARGNYREAPEVVAWGTNKAPLHFFPFTQRVTDEVRLWREVPVVAAYDGDYVGVGRIVSHSTWHHFVNVNLVGFRNADGTPGPVLHRIGQYYRNLAMWLSPWAARVGLLGVALDWVAVHPMVREVTGSPAPLLGATAAVVLQRELGAGVYDDLVQIPLASLSRRQQPDERPVAISHEWLVGAAVQALHRQGARGEQRRRKSPDAEWLSDIGRAALAEVQRSVADSASELASAIARFDDTPAQAPHATERPDHPKKGRSKEARSKKSRKAYAK